MEAYKAKSSLQVVELHMMDKRKYFPLAIASGFSVRVILYPVTLIKTRIQVQKHKSSYTGMYDAFKKITASEGPRGLYKGFWVTSLLVVPQLAYITTYEHVRQFLANETTLTNNKIRSFLSGGCASLVGQTFIVPIDVVSQHLMMIRGKPGSNTNHPTENKHKGISTSGKTIPMIKSIYRTYGLKGFYQGYFTSLAVYAPNSAMWWLFYDIYSSNLADIAPIWVPRLAIQCFAAPLGGVTSALITNPLDIVRARIQVEHSKLLVTAKSLWKEEGLNIFHKGLSARILQSVMFSFFLMLGYESIKRFSLLQEYKDDVKW